MATDEQVEAACMAYHSAAIWARMPEDRTAQRATHGLADTNREAERQVMRAALDAAERAAWRPIAELEDIDSLVMIADENGMLMGLYMPHRQPEGAAWWREVTFPTALLTPARDGEVCDG